MAAKPANAKPGQPVGEGLDMVAEATDEAVDQADDQPQTLEGLAALVDTLAERVELQQETIDAMHGRIDLLQRMVSDRPRDSVSTPAAPVLTQAEAQAQANRSGKAVLSVDGWVSPTTAPKKVPAPF